MTQITVKDLMKGINEQSEIKGANVLLRDGALFCAYPSIDYIETFKQSEVVNIDIIL